MKLKNKIYLVQFFTSSLIGALFLVLYLVYEKKHNEDLEANIKNIVEFNKYNIENSLHEIYKKLNTNQNLYYNIHKFAQEKHIENKTLKLDKLKEEIVSHFNIKDIDIDVFLIDKTYTIFDSTYEKDIGFNLSVIEDAKMYLDKTTKDSKIYVASNVSLDMMDSGLNVYSYSKIDDNLYFELGFKSKDSVYRSLKDGLEKLYEKTNNKVSLYRIIDAANGQEHYSNILRDKSSIKVSKKEYEASLEKFDKNAPTNDNHINAIRYNKQIKEQIGDKLFLYIPIFNKDEHSLLFYNSLLMKIQMDISSHIKVQNDIKNIFILSFLVLVLLFVVLYFIVKKQFYKPMIHLSETFEKEKRVEAKSLVLKKDEFGILVNKYNKLYDSFYNQIEKNQLLLSENKQFIADMVHQIRTPLTVIMTNSSFIEMEGEESLQEYVDQINSSINMLSNSYEDLAYIISNDTIEYKPLDINISTFLKQRVAFFDTIAKANEKTISLNIQEDIIVNINDTELERLIDNNISNAIKHSFDNSNIDISLKRKDDEVVLEFISAGKAIKEPKKLFEKNYTQSNSSKRSLGLGLYMVKTICEKNNIEYNVKLQNVTNIFEYILKK